MISLHPLRTRLHTQPSRLRTFFLLAFCLPCLVTAVPLLAALPTDVLTGAPAATAPAADPVLTADTINSRRAALQAEIARARSDLDKLPEGSQDDTALSLTHEIGLLTRIDGLYAEQLRALQHAADLTQEFTELAALTKNPRPPEVRFPAPRGLPLLDQLYAERDYLIRAKPLLKTDIENATTALADARDELDDQDRLRRTAKEATASPSNRTQAQAVLRLAELECRLAREAVLLAEKSLQTLKLQQSLLAPKLALLLPDFEWVRAHLDLPEADLDGARARQEKRLAELDTAIAEARDEADHTAHLVVTTERRAASSTQPNDDELESRRADRQTVNLRLSALAAQRERQATFVELLQLRRRALGAKATPEEMKTWAETNNDALARLEKARRPLVAQLRKSRRELQDLHTRLADPAASTRKQPWLADRVKHLTAAVAVSERELADLSELTTVRSHLKEELGNHVRTFSWSDTFSSLRDHLLGAWNYEVFSVTDQPIRVKTLLAIVALILAGHWASRRASDLVGHTLSRRLGMNVGRRAAWQTLSFYALFLIVLLTAINLFHLSLTQFSVVSGALAVGIGFGSQTLIGNFISGIILLLERPVNQGDVIEINGQQMTVERLGPRSTLVRSNDNTHVIVPNSRLLEENVINWTLSDDVIRTRITVGVAYDSSTRDVARLLEETLLGLEDVKRDPAPLVLFTDFGENALLFEASFWSSLAGKKNLACELRHRIADSFAKAGIKMAFPQRDVHLEATKPLRVELVPSAPATEKPASA
jgi:potassium-dependent mechanosensitive channel